MVLHGVEVNGVEANGVDLNDTEEHAANCLEDKQTSLQRYNFVNSFAIQQRSAQTKLKVTVTLKQLQKDEETRGNQMRKLRTLHA